MKILTSSEIAAWKSCPQKWWFRYHEELVPNTTPRPLSYGRLAHDGFEAFYGSTSIDAVLNSTDQDPFTVAEVKALLSAYMDRDPVAQMNHTVVAVEEEFCVPLRSPSGRKYNRVMLAGKIDLRTQDQWGSPWLWDHKTSATVLKRDWLALSEQMSNYLWANWQLGRKPVGIIYNLIRKPSIKPHKNELSAEWGERLAKDVASRPEFYFQREAIVKNPRDLAQIERNLWDLAHMVGKGPILRNPSHCQFFGCSYRELCVNDTRISRNAGYRHERSHIELSKEVLPC